MSTATTPTDDTPAGQAPNGKPAASRDAAPVPEGIVRQRLRSGDYVVRDTALDALSGRWGEDWEQWLAASTARLAGTGKAEYDAASGKWVVADRQDKLVLDGEGRVIIAAFPGALDPSEVVRRIRDHELVLSPTTADIVTERLGDGGVAAALDRLATMAETGSMAWRTDIVHGGWRLAADGDVALLDARGRQVQRLFWSRLDDRPGAGVDAVRGAMAGGMLRCGRRVGWRLERSWGPQWEARLAAWLAERAADAAIAENPDHSYEVVHPDGMVLISRDAEVVMGLTLTLTGDADTIRTHAADGTLPTLEDIADERDPRFRSEHKRVLTRFAAKLAKIGEVESLSTYWRIRYRDTEVAVDPTGSRLTKLTTRSTDDADTVRDGLREELVWVRSGVGAVIDAALGRGEWLARLADGDLQRTPRGWDCRLPEGVVSLDGSGTLVVAWTAAS
jgi:hypothetical protein